MVYKKILKYFYVIKTSIHSRTTYKSNLIARSLAVMFRIWMFSQLYIASYKAIGQESIGGLTVVTTIWSMVLVQCFRSSTRPRTDQLIGEDVRSGAIALSLNKPYSFILFHYFNYLGRVVTGLISTLFIGILSAIILVGPLQLPSITSFILGILLLLLGYTLDFFINFIIGIISFWVEDQEPFAWIYQRIQYIFGGLVVPLSLFPERIAHIAEFLPFTHLYYGSARTIVNFEINLFFKYLIIQCCWILFFVFLSILTFKRGMKNVSINAG
ncbi:hypothetical protein KJ644_02105 [Candidatus Dependentiae bacterium]|nr:hypothetical protein [Candidatus Dependentiae bacterium]MBU4387246.1 hypothetical protein [Candidatus Dependentiae bacterium]MCG2756551.1 hypothetical protein [Candidatus Dependentiae bacterium]